MDNGICACGKPLDPESVGRPRKYCRTCSPPKRPPGNKTYLKTCVACMKQFTARMYKAKVCSEKCKWKARPRKPCLQCGGPTGWSLTDTRGGRICNPCRSLNAKKRPKSQPLTWSCKNCGKTRTRPPTKGQVPKYCSKSCEQLAAFHRRRARLINAFVEDVDRSAVFKADSYRCYLCGHKTDPTKSYPHPKSPTIDHVIPLNKGGLHERGNCRTACAKCNSAKQDRGGGEQFALVI